MLSPILRPDLLPFNCQNQKCREKFDAEAFSSVIQNYGLVYADCGDVIYQGINCPKCRKTSIIELPRANKPLVDLRGFIIAPSPYPLNDPFEQVLESERANDGYDYLKFRYIPAWDGGKVSYPDMLSWYHNFYPTFQIGVTGSYLTNPVQVKESLNKENSSEMVVFRRLYPDTPLFRNLLTCLSPNRVSEVIPGFGLKSDCISHQEWHVRNIAWTGMLEEALGKPLKEAVEEAVKHKISSKVDTSQLFDLIEKHRHELWLNQSSPKEYLREQASYIGFEDKIFKWEGWKKLFNDFFSHVGTEIALSYHRNRLSSWINEAKEGQALFVDAPMGIGKSYSVVETLANNPDLSAVIFMPTNNLCEDILDQLKIRISEVRGYIYINQYEERNGFNRIRFNYLDKEIYFADGINKDCLHYKDIIKRYRRYWLRKEDICRKCEILNTCRFRKHQTKAPLRRIVVTTHHQYDRFSINPSVRRWFKDGYYELDGNGKPLYAKNKKGDYIIFKGKDGQEHRKKVKKKGIARNFFIVDEDIVLSRCYQPIGLKSSELNEFIATLIEFLEEKGEEPRVIRDILQFYAQIALCRQSAYIPSINKSFRIKNEIKKLWAGLVADAIDYEPEATESGDLIGIHILDNEPEVIDRSKKLIGNHILILENAMRLGATVQQHSGKEKMVYFPNPKSYDLSKLPPHVFFDGTMLNRTFLKKKLKGVKFKGLRIRFSPFWKYNIWQNTNTDLPRTTLEDDKANVQQFVRDILSQEDKFYRKIFFVTTNANYLGYLKEFLGSGVNVPNVPMTYGDVRGTNEAKECDACIMLGGFVLSDAVEIAMALEFFKKHKISFNDRYVVPRNNFWTWKENKNRIYKPKYDFIGKLAQAYRYAEYRQALARTRYLYHDVDFYIIAKDKVEDFERYLPGALTYNYQEEMFPPKPSFHDVLRDDVRSAIIRYLKERGLGNDSAIYRETRYSRSTIRKYKRELLGEEIIEKVGKIKYRLSKKKTKSG